MSSRARAVRAIPLAWGLVAFVALAAVSSGPGISREESAVLAAAGAAGTDAAGADAMAGAAPAPRPPMAALLARAGAAGAARLGLPHLAGYRLGSVLAAGVLAALVAMLAGELAGPAAAALAPALLLCAPRLLLPLVQAGPRAAGAALVLASLLAYRRAVLAPRRTARIASALAGAVLLGLALAFQLESAQLLAVAAAHALLLPPLLALRRVSPPAPRPEPVVDDWDVRGPTPRSAWRAPAAPLAPPAEPPPAPEPALHPRSAALAVAVMAVVGPAVAFATWPWLWPDPLHRAAAAVAGIGGTVPILHLGRVIEGGRPPAAFSLAVTALSLPASLVLACAGGALHGLWRLWRAVRGGPGLSDELLLLLAAAGPFTAAQLGLAARTPGPGAWLAAFPVLAVLAARAILHCAGAAAGSKAPVLAGLLAAAALAPGLSASAHAYPDLGAAWGELAGGAPGAASLELPRHDGEAAVGLVREISTRARPGARVHWGSIPQAALAVYAADGRIRPDLVAVASPGEADVVLVPVAGKPRDEEYRAWVALREPRPVAAAFLDEVPLAWVYARPGCWR